MLRRLALQSKHRQSEMESLKSIGFIEDAMVSWLHEQLKAPPLGKVEEIQIETGVRISIWKQKITKLIRSPDLIFDVKPGVIIIKCGYTRLESYVEISTDKVVMDKWASNRSYDLADPELFTKMKADIYMIGKILSMGVL